MPSLFLLNGGKERRQALRPTPDAPPDAEERALALDIHHSWIVEAPAGSGKTGLLIQRLLKLLADESVTEPEQVLAITFTVKATGELRDRVLAQLEAAATAATLHTKFDRETRQLAEAVLRRDAALGWHLLENPTRLRIRTIDSVCAEIARSLPVLSGSGGRLAPILDATPLYREAARRAFLHLGGDGPLNDALRTLLLHRDGNLADCERLLAEMLSLRDQWGTLVPLTGPELTDAELDATVLPRLERALDQAICAGLQQLAKSIPPDILEALTGIANELGHMAGYEGNASPFALCANLRNAPGETADHLAHWRALIHLLTTQNRTWRKEKGINKKTIGIHEYDRKFPYHGLLRDVLGAFSQRDDLLFAFGKVRSLPPAKYPPEQWLVAKALFRILHHALVELQLVFATRGECDFTELGLLARAALRRDTEGDDLAAALGLRLQHLLVDEMQDTSTSQYDLVELLTHGWDGQSQTVFLVGDPKQSIYLFRQARVERFVRAMRTGKLGDLPLGTLRLTANFRSQSALVDDTNADFALLFPSEVTPLQPEDVPFVAATPVRDPSATKARAWHTIVLPADSASGNSEASQLKGEARAIRRLIEQWRAKPLPPGRTRPWSLAVLVRNRLHLTEIVAALKRDDRTLPGKSATGGSGPIPFRAVDIEALNERQEILDLLALTRALLHPADRVAWLAILRAPWCGLTLTDLHLLAAGDDPTLSQALIQTLIPRRRHLLSPDGRRRLDRADAILQAASAQRDRLPLSQWVDRTWRALGGNLYLAPEEIANTPCFFHLLDELEHGDFDLVQTLQTRLKKLYADTPPTPGAVELLTIHKAKGLEWDVVLVPGLERKSQSTRSSLLVWTELDAADPASAHIVLAPIPGKGEASRELNDWIRSLENAREAAERKRLLYVAATRAREELHLFGALQAKADGEIAPAAGTLLQAAWPAAQSHFALPAPFAFVPAQEEPALALAAAAETASEPPPPLHRLPGSFSVEDYLDTFLPLPRRSQSSTRGLADAFIRPEGSFAARALGNAVHVFIELLAHCIAGGTPWQTLLAELPQWTPRIHGVLRATGLPPAQVDRLAQRVLAALTHTLTDETGRWIVAAHPGAATEHSLTTWQDQPATVRLDRIFRAGPTPTAPGDTHLWIVDFKTTTHAREGLDLFLQQERARYEPQMQTYAHTLAPIEPVRIMLYYPLLPAHTWWPHEPRTHGPPQNTVSFVSA